MNLTFRQLKYVKTAAECGSISGAAERLSISQSSIGVAIDKVEDEFQVDLFVRKPSKGLVPTSSGRVILRNIDLLISEVQVFSASAAELKNNLESNFHIGCFVSMAPHIMPPILSYLSEEFPQVAVHIHEGGLEEIQTWLKDGEIDIALTYDLELPEQVIVKRFVDVPAHVVVAQSDTLATKYALSLQDLEHKPMVMFDQPESRRYFQMLFESFDFKPNIAYRADTYETVRALVAEGLGYALLNLRPQTSLTYTGKKVACRPLSNTFKAPNFVIVRRSGGAPTRIMNAFVQGCNDYFNSQGAQAHVVRALAPSVTALNRNAASMP